MIHPVADANENSLFGSLSSDEFYAHHSVSHGSDFVINSRGLKLFTQWWIPLPKSNPINGVVCVVHGFTLDSSWLLQLTAVHIAKHGFAVCAIDHQGHGYSEGIVAHIPDVNPVVDDCISFFDSFREQHAPPGMPSFLYGESLGGAITLLITLRKDLKRQFDGVVLHGAMCGVNAKFKPPWPVEHLLSLVASVVPTWQLVPTRGTIPQLSYKVEWKKKLAMSNPKRPLAVRILEIKRQKTIGSEDIRDQALTVVLKPIGDSKRIRVATAFEMLRVCGELQSRFAEVTVPFLIVHGGADLVCDPACVEDLYKNASSKDKTLKIYAGLWHQLVGEIDEDVEHVFPEVMGWLQTRAQRASDSKEGGISK